MSHDVVFDESSSWYSLPSPTPEDAETIVKEEISEVDLLDEEEIGNLVESLISFRLSGSNDRLSQKG